MAYIGKSIDSGTFSVLDTSGNTYNGSNVTFSLGTQVGSPAQLLVSHDGVIQKPGTDYSLATGGTQITFSTAPASGASIFIVEISGAVGGPLDSDLNGTELILDADGDTSITADTDDQIDIKIAGSDHFRLKANEIENVSGDLLIDVVGDINLDANGADVRFQDDGTVIGAFTNDSSDFVVESKVQDKDLSFRGNDNGSVITALTIDMSDGGVLQTRAGVGFPGTQVSSSDANILDDYEEGSWTPASSSISFSSATGRYVKIGAQVTCWFQINFPSTSNSSDARVTGIPFAVVSQNGQGVLGNINNTDIADARVSADSGNQFINLRNEAGAEKTNANFSSRNIRGVITYLQAAD